MNEAINNILADVTYASAYWCICIKTSIPTKKLSGECREDKWFDCLKKGGTLILWYEDADEPATVSWKSLTDAYRKVNKMPMFADESQKDELYDDAILQIAAFGEIIFG